MKAYLQPAFLICVAVLATACGAMSLVSRGFGIVKKTPLPLVKSLRLLDEDGLGPYTVVAKPLIDDARVVKELGTDEYIQWVLEDANAPADSPVKRLLLFITYYPLPDRIPHVPEECWAGSGFQELTSGGITLSVDNKAGFQRRVPARRLVFGSTKGAVQEGRREFPVFYFLRVNGEYAGGRNDARMALNKSLFRRHSYFCKIELVFNQTMSAPSKEQAVAASEALLAVILPVLEKEHWPDWEGAISGN